MRFLACLALVLCLAGAAGRSTAQTWTPIASDVAGSSYAIDMSTIQRDGTRAFAWVRTVYPQPQWLASNPQPYLSDAGREQFDCQHDTVRFESRVFYGASGNIVSSVTGKDKSLPVPPGSTGFTLLGIVCGLNQGLSPALPVGPASNESWKYLGATGGAYYYLDTGQSLKLGGDLTAYIAKTEYGHPAGAVSFAAVMLDCEHVTFAFVATDLYDNSGRLVETSVTPPEQLHPSPIPAGSAADAQRQLVCTPGSQGHAQGSPEGSISTGTAWLGPKGYLITANHVIDGADQIVLMQNGVGVGDAAVVATDPANDVAVLKPRFKDGAHPAIAFSEAAAKLGEDVFTLGYPAPDVMGLSLKMTSGQVSSTAGVDVASQRADDPRLLQVSIPIQPGNSGGPVMDDSGHAVAVVVSARQALDDAHLAQNVNYAVKISYVRALLEGLPDIGGYRPATPAATVVGTVSAVEGGVFLLVARTAHGG